MEFVAYAREKGILPIRTLADLDTYEEAVAEFPRTGDRAVFLQRLLGLGIARNDAHWHVQNPGRRMLAMAPGE
jgi:hypothetical protein